MSVTCNTYELLVDRLGEAGAYKLCEELGGTTINIPKKAHRTFRLRKLVFKALPHIKSDDKYRNKLVKRLSQLQGISKRSVYKIIQEIEYE